jgi:hypothetical protein
MPTLIWSNLAIDFIEALPHVNKTMILTMVDRLSKAAHFIPMGRPYTSTSMAQPVRLDGLPSSIVSNHDPVFISNMWR